MLKLSVEPRNIFGKKLHKIRKDGKIPAVLYGEGKKSTPLFVNLKNFKKIWKEAEESTIINLKNDSNPSFSEDVLIYDVSAEPMKGEPIHIDFYALDVNKPITAEVPLVFDGISGAVKEHGGVLVKVIHKIEIEALPKDFPHEIKVDVSKIANIGDKITVKDLDIPAKIKTTAKGDMIIVLAKPHEEEKVEEKVMTVADVEISEKKGKKEEETAETAAQGTTKQPPGT